MIFDDKKNSNNPSKEDINFILNLFNLKKFNEAEKEIYNKLIQYQNSPVLFNMLGAVLSSQNKLQEAIKSYNKSISINPKYAQAYNNLGVCLYKLGKINDSIYNYNKAIEIQPKDPNSHNNLGVAFKELGEHQKSIVCYEKAIDINPNHADSHNNLGTAFKELGEHDKSINCYQKAVEIDPKHSDAHNNLGTLFNELREFKKAIYHYEKTISNDPTLVASYTNMGNAYRGLGEYEKSISFHKKGIEINPNYADVYFNLGTLYEELNEFDKAIEQYQKAIKIEPDHSGSNNNLLFNICWTNSKIDYLKTAKRFADSIKMHERQQLINIKNSKENTLNIGFISGDFRNHPVAFFLLDTLEHLKKKYIKIFGYNNHAFDDNITKLLQKHFNKWEKVFYKTDKDLINLIRKDKIDILFDLSGHTANNRLAIFKNRCAPIQVTWCGWLASTGIKEIDYILGDEYATPLIDQIKFTEKIYQLKKIWQSLSISNFKINSIELQKSIEKNIIFGSFVKNLKINEEVINTWSQILNKNPNFKLFLKCGSFDIPEAKKNFITRLKNRIKESQLILEGRSQRQEYLNCYNKIDILLDVFPASGATTSFEASYMGTPILTLNNDKGLWLRTGVSINQNLGMNNWIAQNQKDYINKALTFADNKKFLINLKPELRNVALKSPLFDSKNFSDNFYKMLLDISK
jgi:protein O-GlcNAc transferase